MVVFILLILLLVTLWFLSLVKPSWVQQILTYYWRNFTLSGAIATLIDGLEETEREVQEASNLANSDAGRSLPEAVRQRLAQLPEHTRR